MNSRKLRPESDDEFLRHALENAPKVNESQAVQIHRQARMRTALRENHTFLSGPELAQVYPNLVATEDSSRALRNLVTQKHELIGMKDGHRWIFPLCQIDERTGKVFAEFVPVIKKAYQLGQTAWEILYWLVTPTEVAPPIPGSPLPVDANTTAEEFLSLISEDHEADAIATPQALLKADDKRYLCCECICRRQQLSGISKAPIEIRQLQLEVVSPIKLCITRRRHFMRLVPQWIFGKVS